MTTAYERRGAGGGDALGRALLRQVRDAAERGVPLPGEFELMDRLGCSRQQLRNALAELERSGILRRRQGAATTVDPIALRMSVRLEEQFEHTDLLERLGYRAEVEILESVPEPLPVAIARLMDVEAGHPSVRTTKRWRADGRAAMLATGYLLVPDDAPRELHDSVFVAANQVWGDALLWEAATPGAEALDSERAALLEVEPGTAALTLELIGIAASGRRLFYAFEHHLPEVVRYSLSRTVRPPWSLI